MGPEPKPPLERFMPKVNVVGECWLWTGASFRGGYGAFRLNAQRQMRAHRWSYEHFVGPIPEGMVIRHTCDVPRCVNPEHLLVGTSKQNQGDMLERGRLGDRRAASKVNGRKQSVLSPVLAKEIRERYANGGCSYRSLAREYGAHFSTIRAMVIGRTWQD